MKKSSLSLSMCLRKKKMSAKHADKKAKELNFRYKGEKTFRAYYCPVCQHHHLTSKSVSEKVSEKQIERVWGGDVW